MILILGGTTEGRLAANTLDESGSPFYYSTRGDEQEVSLHHGIRLQGGMDAEAMELFCRQKEIRLLVDAAHPFAEELHRNVATVGQRLQIPVIRLERIYPPRTACPVIWCAGYDEAVKKIQQSHPASLLLLTGVQSIARLAALWKDENICCHCRQLTPVGRPPRISSRTPLLLPRRRRRTNRDGATSSGSYHTERKRFVGRI